MNMDITAANDPVDMPVIDARVKHVGVSRLRRLDGKSLKRDVSDNKALVIRERDEPLAVLLSYEQYLIIQNKLNAVVETLDIISRSEEAQMLIAGLREVKAGNTKSLDDIRKSLNHNPE